jgi:hypothetical protein
MDKIKEQTIYLFHFLIIDREKTMKNIRKSKTATRSGKWTIFPAVIPAIRAISNGIKGLSILVSFQVWEPNKICFYHKSTKIRKHEKENLMHP